MNDRLGTGGFATVYLATDDENDERVAIKVLHEHTSNEADLRRFERERMTMRAFSEHPNIVSVYDSGQTEEGSHYTVLEFVDGGSVRDLIVAQGALHWADVLGIAVQICSALDVAHRSGVLHRDVKPANVLLSGDDAKLNDFGIARLVGQSQVTAAQSIIGTLAYTPPEVFHNKPFDGRGDIYQLGITMYEMLLGRAPFTSAAADNKAAIIRRIIEKPAPSLAPFDIPQQISDLLDEVLAKDPADRPQSAERLGMRLNEIEVELGRTPTVMHRDVETSEAGGIETIHAPTMSIDMTPDPTIDIGTIDRSTASESEWPAAAGAASTPTPPTITPPDDVNLTVAEPRPQPATSLIAKPDPEPTAAPKPTPTKVKTKSAATPAPAAPVESSRTRRAPWLIFLLLLLAVAGAGVWYAFTQLDDNTADGEVEGSGEEEPNPEGDGESGPPLVERSFAAAETTVFAEPAGEHGLIFGSVATPGGLTLVGGAGNGEGVDDQRSIVWTLGPEGFALQREFDDGPHRMWSIGTNGDTFLTVGETGQPGQTSGVAWTGGQADALAQVTNNAADQLRVAVGDPASGNSFLVGGSRTVGTVAPPGLWQVSGEPSWSNPTWTAIDLGNDLPGVINDIAVDGDTAVAVGMGTSTDEGAAGGDEGAAFIRRDGEWVRLIAPIPHVQLWSVVIVDDQIFAVGEQNTNTDFPQPYAIVLDMSGAGQAHRLPIQTKELERSEGVDLSGIARAITVLSDGSVVAVGDVDQVLAGSDPAEIDRDGAIWEYQPDQDDLNWTTRVPNDTVADGFTELWTINEFDDTVYVFGRTETEDGRRPAGAWTLNLN